MPRQVRGGFYRHMGIVEEEADETIYWMELLVDSGITQRHEVAAIIEEADQIVAIVVASIKTARGGKRS